METYNTYQKKLKEIAESEDGSTNGTSDIKSRKKLAIWQETVGGKSKGKVYGTAELSSNFTREGATIFYTTQECCDDELITHDVRLQKELEELRHAQEAERLAHEEERRAQEEKIAEMEKSMELIVSRLATIEAIFKTLDPITFSKIKHLKTAMEIWQGLGKLCEGSEDLRKQKIEVLLEKFKSFKMLPGESFDMLDERFHKILNDFASLNHILSPKEKNVRLLRSHPTEWYTKATAMEEGRNLENYTVQGLLDELRTYEHELKKKKEEQVTPFPTALMTTPRIPSSEGTCTRNCDTPSSSQPSSSKMENYNEEFAMMVKQFRKFKKFFKKADSVRRPFKGKPQVSDSPPESYLCYNCRKPGHWKSACPYPKVEKYGERERNEKKKKAMVAAESDESSSSSSDEALVCMERRVEKSNHEDRWTMSEDDTLCLMAKDDADQDVTSQTSCSSSYSIPTSENLFDQFKKMMEDFEEINLKHSSLTEENKLLSEENLKLTESPKSQLNEITQLKTENESLSEKVKSLNKELGILKSKEAVNKLLETTKHKGREGLGFDPSSSKRKGKTTFIPPKPTAKPNKQKGKEKEKPTEVPKKVEKYGERERNEKKKKAMVAAESDESSSSSSDEEALVCMERRVEKSNHEDRWTMSEDDTLCLMAKDDADQEVTSQTSCSSSYSIPTSENLFDQFKKMMKDFEEINLKHSSLTEENKLLSEENLKLTESRKSQLNEITQLKTENESLSEKVKSLNKELGILKSKEAVNKLLETTKHKGREGLGFDPSSSKRKGKTTFIPPKPTAKPNKQKGKEKEKPTEVPKKVVPPKNYRKLDRPQKGNNFRRKPSNPQYTRGYTHYGVDRSFPKNSEWRTMPRYSHPPPQKLFVPPKYAYNRHRSHYAQPRQNYRSYQPRFARRKQEIAPPARRKFYAYNYDYNPNKFRATRKNPYNFKLDVGTHTTSKTDADNCFF
ncbi:unnamed protein product [Cuscuta campestris]|uniref:CCHC-type domain-containing protein n=1 Tax=Cuscuta campestris TaxID=132261 RepID=A0A484M6H5_9ASTE|nr:unnamed protein product [Cuscuta campestris]